MTDSGFVAGTLVHTDKGLVPIQDIKIGDMVLSMAEEGVGETAYKPVVSVFKSVEKQPVMAPLTTLDIICTESHPFWTLECGWVEAKDLDVNSHNIFYLGQDNKGYYDYPSYFGHHKDSYTDPFRVGGLFLLATADKDIAYAINGQDENLSQIKGNFINFKENGRLICTNDRESIIDEFMPSREGEETDKNQIVLDKYKDHEKIDYYESLLNQLMNVCHEHSAYKDYVYNIEVADYHTYFVGEPAYWVHDYDPVH